MLRHLTHPVAWLLLALIAVGLGVGAAGGDLCADDGEAGCEQPCHLSCPDGCANATLGAVLSLPGPALFEEVRLCAPHEIPIRVAAPDFQPPRLSAV